MQFQYWVLLKYPFGSLKKRLTNIFSKHKDNLNINDAYNQEYQDRNPKNYGVETIYYSSIKKTSSTLSNPTIWNCKTINSSPWFKKDNWSEILENNVEIIKKEFYSTNILSTEHPGNKLLAEFGTWSSITLVGPKSIEMKYAKHFSKTIKLLEKMPICRTFGFIAFSKLSPKTHIKAHTGSCNVRLRYHLGIDVPEPEFVKIRVGNEQRSWFQDKCLIFDDSFEHEVFHNGTKDRIVLIVDLWHPQLSTNEIKILNSVEFENFGKI